MSNAAAKKKKPQGGAPRGKEKKTTSSVSPVVKKSSPLGEAALAYAAQGLPVFSLWPGKKTPHSKLAPHGFKNATTDPAIIKKWWTEVPHANIGMPTGTPSGLLVIDVDKDELKNLDGELADTLRLETPTNAGRRTLTGAMPPAANAGPAVEVMLRTHSYWSGITDFTMRSYYLVSAGQR